MKKPTVTELCDILNKPQLVKWANNLGLSGVSVEAYRKDKFKGGNAKHNEIEDYLISGVYIEDDIKRGKIDALFDGTNIISIEESFENEKYKGRVDIRFEKNNVSYICDFKSKFKRPYMEHFIQLYAYKLHFGCDKIGIIDLNNFELHEFDTHNESKYLELIDCLINIYNLKQVLK